MGKEGVRELITYTSGGGFQEKDSSRKNQAEMLEIESTVTEIKNVFERLFGKLQTTEQRLNFDT